MKFSALIVLFLLAMANFAHADQVPDSAFNNYYQNCMGGESAAKEPQRAQYCGCIRDKIKDWSPQQYADMSAEMAKAGGTPQATPDLEALAKECIALVLK